MVGVDVVEADGLFELDAEIVAEADEVQDRGSVAAVFVFESLLWARVVGF